MRHLETNEHNITTIEFLVPTRGLMGYRNEFLTATRGLGIIHRYLIVILLGRERSLAEKRER